jgi:hypothetical protein
LKGLEEGRGGKQKDRERIISKFIAYVHEDGITKCVEIC